MTTVHINAHVDLQGLIEATGLAVNRSHVGELNAQDAVRLRRFAEIIDMRLEDEANAKQSRGRS